MYLKNRINDIFIQHTMIESLALTNFYSFKERTEIAFIAGRERNREQDEKLCGFVNINRVNLLKMSYILGDNGAGKSNLIAAFGALSYLVAGIREDKTEPLNYMPFAFDEKCTFLPSTLELIYHYAGVRYAYTISWNENTILLEELHELRPRSTVLLYKRTFVSEERPINIEYGQALKITDDEKYLLKTGLLKNNALCSIVLKTNISNPILNGQQMFFREGFEVLDVDDIDLNESLPDDKIEIDKALKRCILELLKSIGSNIVHYEKLLVPQTIPPYFLEHIKQMSQSQREQIMKELREQYQFTINTYHKIGRGKRYRLPLSVQSRGTQEILKFLLCMTDAIKNKKTIILDDFSSCIHRDTLNRLIHFFVVGATESQLIISTQDYSLLDSELVRRDSLRIFTKNDMGETQIDSLTLSELHKNLNLYKYISTHNTFNQKPYIDDRIFDDAIENFLIHLSKEE